jgi:hypothetical protein
MHETKYLVIILAFLCIPVLAAEYPPDTILTFKAMPVNVPMPAYLVPYADPTFKTKVTRVADKNAMGITKNIVAHHYAKSQPWNSNGTLIKLAGWPSAILDGATYQFKKWVMPPGDHHVWSNVDPNRIYGIQQPNTWEWVDARDGSVHPMRVFSGYTHVSLGEFEGNISNDDHYAVFQAKSANSNWIFVYDMFLDSVISKLDIGGTYPNNVSMSQSGTYVVVGGASNGTDRYQGTEVYDRQLNFLRHISNDNNHADLGYNTAGKEVCVKTDESNRGIVAYRLDTGEKTVLLTDAQMSWYIHVSCRATNRPGWAYLTEFADPNTQTSKPNYQVAFGVKVDGSGTVERFAHVHHSTAVDYERSPFGVPNRDGSKMMFRSDWDNGSGPIYSYIAEMPGATGILIVSKNQNSAESSKPLSSMGIEVNGKWIEKHSFKIFPRRSLSPLQPCTRNNDCQP